MSFLADLHIHSKYSLATSKNMDVDALSCWGKDKGIKLLGTGDFTHPKYFSELKDKLKPVSNGLYTLKGGDESVYFMLSAEVNHIFKDAGRMRKVHMLIFAPSFEVVEKINKKLAPRGKLASDGRPIFCFPVRDLVKLALDICPDCLLVPAHIWTPWFSLLGAKSGYNCLEECFLDEAKYIYAVETGLSSDPAMNWRLSALDKLTLLSNSDAHSPAKIGREANIFDCVLDYYEIMDVIKKKKEGFCGTIEFFPQEGKYHYDGHRACNIMFSPDETQKHMGICPVCGKGLTVGVLNRIDELADRPAGFIPPSAKAVTHLVCLQEIIAQALGRGINTKGVQKEYQRLIYEAGSEFNILLHEELAQLADLLPDKILDGVSRMRSGNLNITPGYDGVFGKVKIWGA